MGIITVNQKYNKRYQDRRIIGTVNKRKAKAIFKKNYFH